MNNMRRVFKPQYGLKDKVSITDVISTCFGRKIDYLRDSNTRTLLEMF